MIYVLTEEYNDYDQYGEYFVHAWIGKPNREQLRKQLVNANDKSLDYILTGGGRTRRDENHWYHLREVEDDRT